MQGSSYNWSKYNFFQEKVSYLGHIVSRDGVSVDPAKFDKVQNCSTPENTKEIQQFLGLANYYQRLSATLLI